MYRTRRSLGHFTTIHGCPSIIPPTFVVGTGGSSSVETRPDDPGHPPANFPIQSVPLFGRERNWNGLGSEGYRLKGGDLRTTREGQVGGVETDPERRVNLKEGVREVYFRMDEPFYFLTALLEAPTLTIHCLTQRGWCKRTREGTNIRTFESPRSPSECLEPS